VGRGRWAFVSYLHCGFAMGLRAWIGRVGE
jgi:hypothetical protein